MINQVYIIIYIVMHQYMFKIESKKQILNIYAGSMDKAHLIAETYAHRKNLKLEYVGRKGKPQKNKWTKMYKDVNEMEKAQYARINAIF